MLQVDLEDVLDLEHLAHPRWTQVSVVVCLRVTAVISSMEVLHSREAQVFVHDRLRGAVNHRCRLVTAIFFHRGDLELKVLLFFFAGGTAFLLHGFQIGDKSIVVTRGGFSASELPMELKLVALNVLVALGVVAVEPDVDHLARVVLVLDKAHLALTLRRAEQS